MKTLTDHKCNELNDALTIEAVDAVGNGGAHHYYDIRLPSWSREPIAPDETFKTGASRNCWALLFQNGPILEVGFNGLTNEALLAVVIDRMRGFQSGPFACRENALALTKLEEALMWLQKRTRDRIQRGVEGTLLK